MPQWLFPACLAPCLWYALLREGSSSLMALFIFGVTRSIIYAIVVCLRVIHHDSMMFPILGFYCCPARTGWRFWWGVLTWFICSMVSAFAATSGMSWGTSAWGWSSVWCVTAIMISTEVTALWSAPIVASTFPVMCLCGRCDDYSFYICMVGIAILICCVCICPGDGV